MAMHEETLRQQQEAQSDHDALHRFENEGGAVGRYDFVATNEQVAEALLRSPVWRTFADAVTEAARGMADRAASRTPHLDDLDAIDALLAEPDGAQTPTMAEMCDFYESTFDAMSKVSEAFDERAKVLSSGVDYASGPDFTGYQEIVRPGVASDAALCAYYKTGGKDWTHLGLSDTFDPCRCEDCQKQWAAGHVVTHLEGIFGPGQLVPTRIMTGEDYGSKPGYAVDSDGNLLEAELPECYGLGEMPLPRIVPAEPPAEGTAADDLAKRGIRVRSLAELELTADQAAAINVEMGLQRQAEAEALAADLDSDPLSRAYRSLKTAKTGKEKRSAASRVRRATRHKMARTMRDNNDTFKQNPNLAMTIAAQIVRGTMSTHADK